MIKSTSKTSMSRDDLVEVVREMLANKCSRSRMGELSSLFQEHVPHPDWLELLYYPPLSAKMRPPEEIVDLALAYVPVRVEHPLLERLIGVAKKATQELFPGKDYRYVFDPAGLLFCDVIRKSALWCDPENSAEFIHTGCDGHHFSFLVVDNVVHEDSPVMLCCPDDGVRSNAVVGEDLHDFLPMGMHCGYSDLLSAMGRNDSHDAQSDSDVDKSQILQLLRDELDLKPWTNRSRRFQELQDRFLPLFKMPPTE